MSQAEQPLISHLVELRTRLLRAISAILLGVHRAHLLLQQHLRLRGPAAAQPSCRQAPA